ncbi:methionine--tRNA ligase [Nocardiopsis mangrovi]|uniref:Methionine--tRNA ligase n=1 Tax=Nocardiopsis mangrovi TaxID=1179818 RepID=A0ABV9E3D9_9ACTN
MSRYHVTTAIPYVNGRPHIGHALELVQADTLARYRRLLGDEVRSQTGTDDNSLKSVHSAEAAGIGTREYVARAARAFLDLREPLELSFTDSVQTGSDPRHRPGVEKLWTACADRGDLYRGSYSGRYCTACEQFYTRAELAGGLCPEHGWPPEHVEEENWFFRLSRYQDRLRGLIAGDTLRVRPEKRKREVLAFIDSGLADISVSRGRERARGWGIPVPGDPEQVVYVWFDALANYITGPGYGTDDAAFTHWWTRADERVHVVGKGIVRFHAVHWPALLLSAGLRPPTEILVHDYLTENGRKISKSAGTGADPAELARRFGPDALRWWLLRDVAPSDDTDYGDRRLIGRYNEDLANNVGNLVHRTAAMVTRYRSGAVPAIVDGDGAGPGAILAHARRQASADVHRALAVADFRAAARAVTDLAGAGNRAVEAYAPWAPARAERERGTSTRALDGVLAELVVTGRLLARLLGPFLPAAAEKITAQLTGAGGTIGVPAPIFRRLDPDALGG